MAVHVPPRIYRRVPFATAVRLQFDRFRGFVEEYSANLSLGGMFIRTDEPAPVGTEMPIEFRLGHDYELIKGRGRVVWARRQAVDDEHPAGMGLRFLELTPGSRELIFKLVERRVREGGDLFDLDHEADLLPERPPEPGPGPEQVVEAGRRRRAAEPLPETSFDGLLETEGAAAGARRRGRRTPPCDRLTAPGRGGDALRQAEGSGEGDPVLSEERGSGEDARDEERRRSRAARRAGRAAADDDPRWPVLELEDGFGMELGGGGHAGAASRCGRPCRGRPGGRCGRGRVRPAGGTFRAVRAGRARAARGFPALGSPGSDVAASRYPACRRRACRALGTRLRGLLRRWAEAGDPGGDAADALRWQDPLDDEGELPAAFSGSTEPRGEAGAGVAAADDEPPRLAVPPGAYAGAGYAGVANGIVAAPSSAPLAAAAGRAGGARRRLVAVRRVAVRRCVRGVRGAAVPRRGGACGGPVRG